MRKTVAIAACLCLPAAADPAGVHQYESLALSPSGARVASVEVLAPMLDQATEPHGRIVIRSARDGAIERTLDPSPKGSYDGLCWSPDGRTLAFLARDPKKKTVALEIAVDGAVRALWTVKGTLGKPRWSPDGSRLAVLAVVGAHKLVGAVEPGAPQVGEIGAVETQDEQRIAVVPLAGGAPGLISPPDRWVYEYDWAPDGRSFAATSAKGNGDNNWWVAQLVRFDLAGGERVIAAPTMQMSCPRVSPDGRTVAFIGGLMSDFGSIGGDLYSAPFDGGAPVDLTPGYRGSFTSLAWRAGHLMGTVLTQDKTAVFRLEGERVELLRAEPATLSAGDGLVALSSDGSVGATVSQTFESPPEILTGPVEHMAPVTRSNRDLVPQVRARSVSWTSDGGPVQGWLLEPRELGSQPHPMIVTVHGGPAAAFTPTYISAHQTLLPTRDLIRAGCLIFMPNPRGSYGQGEAFTAANRRDFGGGDLRDILSGVDAVEKIAPVDDSRLGVFGHSYGGFMTMWAVTHTARFKAAVAGAGIANWISYYGENGINQWMIPFFGASAYDDPAIYQQLSPLTTIKAARTPTLIYVGERDVECPAVQSLEFWRGLEAQHVPSSLVIYAGQGHRIRSLKDLKDLRARILAWFARYLQPASAGAPQSPGRQRE